MASYYEHDAQSSGKPMLSFPIIPGTQVAGAFPTTLDIPLLLTTYMVPNRKSTVNPIGVLPIISNKGLAYGGVAMGAGVAELPKVSMEGTIDTPLAVNSFALPDIVYSGVRFTYADMIAMYLEGRAAASGWEFVDPLWFRDPYGRIYNSPKIIDFGASYVEAVPGRTNFNMILKV